MEIEYCTPQIHSGNLAVEWVIQTSENPMIRTMEDGLSLTEKVNNALGVLKFIVHTGRERIIFSYNIAEENRKTNREKSRRRKNLCIGLVRIIFFGF